MSKIEKEWFGKREREIKIVKERGRESERERGKERKKETKKGIS